MTMFGSRWANAQVTNIDNNTLICAARLIIGATRKSRITSSLLIANLLSGVLDFTYTMPPGCGQYSRPTLLERRALRRVHQRGQEDEHKDLNPIWKLAKRSGSGLVWMMQSPCQPAKTEVAG